MAIQREAKRERQQIGKPPALRITHGKKNAKTARKKRQYTNNKRSVAREQVNTTGTRTKHEQIGTAGHESNKSAQKKKNTVGERNIEVQGERPSRASNTSAIRAGHKRMYKTRRTPDTIQQQQQ